MIDLQSPLLSGAPWLAPGYLFLYLWSLAVWLRWALPVMLILTPPPTLPQGGWRCAAGVPIAKRELLRGWLVGLACWLAGHLH